MKPKALRKLIQQHFKKVAVLSELECMFKFFDLLRAHYRFDQERFICALGVRFCSVNFESDQFLQRCLNFFFLLQSSWSIPVELVIGPDLGISYMAHRGGTVVSIKLFLNNFTCFLSSRVNQYNFCSQRESRNSPRYNLSKRWCPIARNTQKLVLN